MLCFGVIRSIFFALATIQRVVMRDVMNLKRQELSEDKKLSIETVKNLGNEFYAHLSDSSIPQNREISLAKTKIEEAVMWAVKGICVEY